MKLLWRAGLLAASVLMVFGGVAEAAVEQASVIDANVPFPFLVDGQTLPAGRYRLERDGDAELIRGESVKAAAFVLTMPLEDSSPAGGRPVLTFTRGEDQTEYRLADIWEASGERREIESKAAQHHSYLSLASHSTAGVVKSIDTESLVINPAARQRADMTFALNQSTQQEGAIVVGSSVSVRYREEGSRHVATAVTLLHSKQMAAHHPQAGQ